MDKGNFSHIILGIIFAKTPEAKTVEVYKNVEPHFVTKTKNIFYMLKLGQIAICF